MVSAAFFLMGCDLESVVKTKVPGPIKDVLTLEGQSPAAHKLSLSSGLKIISPKPDQVFAADRVVLFQADFKKEKEKSPVPEITWKLISEKQGRAKDIGQGLSVGTRLGHGSYSAELHATLGEQRVVKKVNFKVSPIINGKVMAKDGSGLGQTEVELVRPKDQEVVSKAQTSADGVFTLILPAEEEFIVVPKKQGYVFSPLRKAIKSSKDGPLEFSGQKGEVTNVLLTQTGDSEENLKNLCPSEPVFLKFKIHLEEKLSSLQVFLVDPQNEAQVQPFDPKISENVAEHIDASGIAKVRIAAPTAAAIGPPKGPYAIRLKIADDKNNEYIAESNQPVTIDYADCFRTRMAQALDLQEKGNNAEAIKIYASLEEMFNAVHDVTAFTDAMDKATYNRGIANLKLALDENDDASRAVLLNRSIQDFARYLKARKNDAQALMFRGAAYQAKGDYKSALKDYDSCVNVNPHLGPAFEVRGQVNLKMGIRKNLVQAIDDFTEALASDRDNKALRESRKEATKIAAKNKDDIDDRRVDVSTIPVRPLKEWLEVPQYLRK